MSGNHFLFKVIYRVRKRRIYAKKLEKQPFLLISNEKLVLCVAKNMVLATDQEPFKLIRCQSEKRYFRTPYDNDIYRLSENFHVENKAHKLLRRSVELLEKYSPLT